MSENGTFWKRSPKWINLKTPAKCVSVAAKTLALSQSLFNHWSKMADELLIMLLCLLSLWIACLEINVALYNPYATALHRRRNTVCSALLSNGPQQTLPCYRVRPYLERRFKTVLFCFSVDSETVWKCGRRTFYPFSRQKLRFQIYAA